MHVNGVIWGAFSTLFIGLCYYIVPRLTGVRVWGEGWSRALLWVWNLNLAAAVVLLALGWNRGWEAGEFPLVNVVVTFLAIVAAHRSVPDDDQAAAAAAALRLALVPDRAPSSGPT